MTALFSLANTLLALLLWLLVMRLLILNWSRGGAFAALFIAFVVLLLAYDLVIAIIAAALMVLFVPRVAQSGLGSAGMRALSLVTYPVVELVRSVFGRRIGTGAALVIAALAVLAARLALFVTVGR